LVKVTKRLNRFVCLSDINKLGRFDLKRKLMKSIGFQNTLDDQRDYLRYWAFSTAEGKKWVRNNLLLTQSLVLISFLLIWGFTDSLVSPLAFIFLFYLFSFMIIGLRPGKWVANKIFERRLNAFSEKDVEIYQLPKTITFSVDEVSVSSTVETNSISWYGVRDIEKTDEFIRIQYSRNNQWLIPRRAFDSDLEYDDTYEEILKLKGQDGTT